MDQKPTPSIQVGGRRLVFSDASLISNPGISKNQLQVTPQESWIGRSGSL